MHSRFPAFMSYNPAVVTKLPLSYFCSYQLPLIHNTISNPNKTHWFIKLALDGILLWSVVGSLTGVSSCLNPQEYCHMTSNHFYCSVNSPCIRRNSVSSEIIGKKVSSPWDHRKIVFQKQGYRAISVCYKDVQEIIAKHRTFVSIS